MDQPDVRVIVHGHFYQPPRENPWTDEVPEQGSARPYHDWNERILAECYRPNTASRVLDPAGRILPGFKGGFNFRDRKFDGEFISVPYAINAVNPDRLLLGRFGLYESLDGGSTIREITPLRDRLQPTKTYTAVAYGGRKDGKPEEHIAYVALGNRIEVRRPGTNTFASSTPPGAALISDLALDPDNWEIASRSVAAVSVPVTRLPSKLRAT